MNSDSKRRKSYKWAITLLAVITVGAAIWSITRGAKGQAPSAWTGNTSKFTPAHSSVGEAVRHFFFLRSGEPEQPIAYTHKVHVQDNGMECMSCHTTADKGPAASIPNLGVCMGCHAEIATEHPEIVKMAEYEARGEDIPWKRVYGWTDEAHVKFNHAPHIRAEVTCETCHGDVKEMTVARRVVDHTMGFCVGCHEQRQASNDCMTCHY